MHVDALDGAARLPGVVECTIDDVLDGEIKRCIRGHVGRVFATELEPGVHHVARGVGIHFVAAFDRARKRQVTDALVTDELGGLLVRDEDVLHEVRHAELAEGLGKGAADERRLGAVL